MGRIPNYLKTTTNKYKGKITEKVASNYLRKKGFACAPFENVHLVHGEHFRKRWEEEKEGWERDLKKYSSKSPPKDWRFVLPDTKRLELWEEYRKEQLKITRLRIDSVHRFIEEDKEFVRMWGAYLETLRNYFKWIENYKHYPRYPDFVAKKGEKVFIVEVKSQSRGKMAFFGKHQKKALLKAYDFGLTPMLLVVPLKLNVEIGQRARADWQTAFTDLVNLVLASTRRFPAGRLFLQFFRRACMHNHPEHNYLGRITLLI